MKRLICAMVISGSAQAWALPSFIEAKVRTAMLEKKGVKTKKHVANANLDCTDFSGYWVGECSVAAMDLNFEIAMLAEQSTCGGLELEFPEGFTQDINIGEFSTVSKTHTQNGENGTFWVPGTTSETVLHEWNEDRTEILTKGTVVEIDSFRPEGQSSNATNNTTDGVIRLVNENQLQMRNSFVGFGFEMELVCNTNRSR